jgi:HK97 gp10 family phage protein
MSLSARAQFTPRSDLGQFVPVHITPGVVASVEAACKLIEERAQSIAPVETGALRDSIMTSVDDSGKTVVGTVSVGVFYAAYVEYGTGIRGAESADAGPGPYSPTWPGMTPRPYMRPAFDEARGAVLDLFRSNISLSL